MTILPKKDILQLRSTKNKYQGGKRMGMKKLKKAAMIAAASMFVMMMPMIQTHAAPTDVIENNESGIPDKTLYQNILKVIKKYLWKV